MAKIKTKNKSLCCVYLLWLLVGIFDAHRFYLHKYCAAVIWMFTFGLFGIGWLIDMCIAPPIIMRYNEIVDRET